MFQARRPARVHAVVKQVCFSLIPLVVVLGVGELVLRIISPTWMACVRTRACPHPEQLPRFVTEQKSNFSLETREPFLVYQHELFWWPRSHVFGTFWSTPDVRTNTFGLRDREPDLSARKRNILLVGDSVVWGSLVREEERFGNVLQNRLMQLSEYRDVQIVNAGVVGFSSFQVLQYLRTRGLRRFEPRAVVFCMGINDSWPVVTGDRQEFERNHRPVVRIRRLLEHSNIFLFVERYASEVVTWVSTGRNPTGLDFLYYDDKRTPEVLRNTPQETEENFRKGGSLVEACDAIPILVLEDTRIAHPPMWNAECFSQSREKMRLVAQTKGWPVIDIAVLSGEPWRLDRKEYLLDFCHLHPRGHLVIGSMLADTLVQYIAPHEG